MTDPKFWFAIYTKPRWEKKVKTSLEQRGFESYCPLNRIKKKWSDRIKVIHEPLFKSYVFVRISLEQQGEIRFIDGVVNYVYWQGKPARIKDGEIDLIRKFLSDYPTVEAIPIDIRIMDEVMINRGLLVGETGKVITIMHNYAQVLIETLGYKLIAKFDKKSLEPLSVTRGVDNAKTKH